MIKAIIIDDEASIRADIRERITTHFKNEINSIQEADSVASGIKAIEACKPQLVLLDVDLGDGTSFDLLQKVTYKDFDVIFVTGYDTHAIKAIKVGALDYILKPVDHDEFIAALQKVTTKEKKESNLEKLVEISSEYFNGVKNKRVVLKTSDNVYAIYEDDIIYCRSDGNYTTFYTQQLEKIMISKSIKKVGEILSEDTFIRCHQSYIVNKKHVLKYNKQGVLVVHLDIKVPVSSRRKEYVLKRIFD
ncbi:LytTR family DNA-binding domain-containing protein [uncultured Dokdonia sp.]|uniref:LytR/AlgR family response regulator transcription factor n=1 Tax=uncultured Dokdonia sp. TaxID=575653 RepID=UPI00262BA9C4|nr:LytTR family DNA-binding domain-containing protein [uncultured Dokdonia sp.]